MIKRSGYRLLFIAAVISIIPFFSCKETSVSPDGVIQKEGRLFTQVPAGQSGIDFQNILVETEASNYYQYMYSYIGGGVAAADFDQDGLIDLFFTSNTYDNKLYLNRGDLRFEDVTQAAGIEKRAGFDAGVTVADVNNDGWPDIYITRGGADPSDGRFANMLYINQGKTDGPISFEEQAQVFGLADANRGITSTFFDYDKDGDLDVYISNTPDFEDKGAEVLDLVAAQTDPRTIELKGYDKLYNNDGAGHFTDVSIQAGILPDIGFGLNPQVGDLNNDGWLDVYVCNDFRIPDFAYLNNGDGTFREGRNELLKHMSFNSMGSDIADINNDGFPDLFALDMNPEDYVRSKTTMAMTSLDLFAEMVRKDYHHQYMHNMLQVNNGNGTFREIANLSGVANTDWSWACLLADFDLDGYNDIYITNGVFRDVIDRDANNEILRTLRENQRKPTDADFLAFAQMLPQQKLTNYLFRNRGDLTFEDVSQTWTEAAPTFSNGAVYADLDNDGDLDLVVNNINEAAGILKNEAVEQQRGHFLQVQFSGSDQNRQGVGTIVKLSFGEEILTRRLIHTRGFLSSVSSRLHFGLGSRNNVPQLEVIWPDGKTQKLENIAADQLLTLDYADAAQEDPGKSTAATTTLFQKQDFAPIHIDPVFNDYQLQILLPHKLSQTGPAAASADVNGDGLPDIYLGGGHTQPGQLLIADANGGFTPKPTPDFERDQQKEDVGACFFDADNDGDTDLYVVSGSYEFNPNSKLLRDRLYLNDGRGNFTQSAQGLPDFAAAGSIVRAADFDQDGDLDLFVGGRVRPGQYPFPPASQLLVNEKGRFTLATPALAPGLESAGMVTDAVWHDIDADEDADLILTGEWMGIEVWENTGSGLQRSEAYENLRNTTGWWNSLLVEDIDQDGDPDIIAGNQGLNYKIHASPEKPFHVYANDFDRSGTVDIFLAKNYQGKEVPVRGKTCTAQQMPHLAQKIPTYQDFASRDLAAIIGPGIESALHYEITELRSGIFYNQGDGTFSFTALPLPAQEAPVMGLLYHDFDGDQYPDLLLAGNNYLAEIETTRSDAGIGHLLKGNGKGEFTPVSQRHSGFFANRDVRDMLLLNHASRLQIVIINNNDRHELFDVSMQLDRQLVN